MKQDIGVTLTRVELNWLYRQLEAGRKKSDAYVKTFTGELTGSKKEEHIEAIRTLDDLTALCTAMKDRLDQGERERAKLQFMVEELHEALELVGDDETAQAEVSKRLAALPKEEPYLISFDRASAKFVLKLVEEDLHKFRSHIIPNYEKTKDEDYTDPVQTKTFWVNKARKSKTILENLKIKMERSL